MAIRRITRTALAATAALALLPGLAACSGGGQTVEEACKVIQSGNEDLNASLSEISTSMTSGDSSALAEQVGSVNDEISALGEKVTNDEVKPAFDRFAGAFGDLTEQIDAMTGLDMTDADAVTEASAAMTASSSELTDAQSELTEVCGA